MNKLGRCVVLIAVAYLVAGCATVYQQLDPEKLYRRDGRIEFGNKVYEGVVVAPQQTSYDFVVEPKGGIDLLVLRTCHREYVAEKIDGGFLGLSGNKWKYTYRPVPGIEDKGFCPLRVDFFESSEEGRHSWVYMDFEHPEQYPVRGEMFCSSEITSFVGVSVCQSKIGLKQRINFHEGPIQFHVKPDACSSPKRVMGYPWAYEITASPGECLYSFRTKDNRRGYLNMIGYTGILVREGQ